MYKFPDYRIRREISIEEIQRLYETTKVNRDRIERELSRKLQKAKEPNFAAMLNPKNISAGELENEEYLFAVKRLKRLLTITPEVSIRTKLKPYQELFPKGEFPIRPVRKIPKSAKRVTGVSLNTKGSYPAEWESRLEGNYLTYLDFTEAVAFYLPQPLTLEWRDAKRKKHKYTPDVFIVWAEKGLSKVVPAPWLAEVKYQSDLDKNETEYAPKFAAAKEYAEERGWQFHTVTEGDIPAIYLKNILFLKRYRRMDTTDAAVAIAQKLISHLFEMETSTVQNLIEAAFDDETNRMLALGLVWRLVVAREIMTDLGEPLTNNSILWLPDKYCDDILDPESYQE